MNATLRKCCVLSLSLVACAEASVDDDGLANERQSEAITGSLSFWNAYVCSAEQQSVLRDAVTLGRRIVETAEYQVCLESRIVHQYMACSSDDNRSGATAAHASQVASVSRSANALTIGCDNTLGWYAGKTNGGDIHSFGHGQTERVRVGTFEASSPTYYQQVKLASTIWHEVMHTQDYQHDSCGYPPEANYVGNHNSMPDIVADCLTQAGMSNTAGGFDRGSLSSAPMQSFGWGTYSDAAGDFTVLGNNRISSVVVPPGMALTLCDRDSPRSGCESWTTTSFRNLPHNANLYYEFTESDAKNNTASAISVEPRVVGFRLASFGGDSQGFGLGTHRADRGQLAAVGNDQLRSVLVPAGLKVRVCQHENGGRGGGICSSPFTSSVADVGTLNAGLRNNVSFIEVSPVVTAFVHHHLLGARRSFDIGTYRSDRPAELGAQWDRIVSSMVIPPGLEVRACTSVGEGHGGGTCRVYSRTILDLADFNDQISFLEVRRSAP